MPSLFHCVLWLRGASKGKLTCAVVMMKSSAASVVTVHSSGYVSLDDDDNEFDDDSKQAGHYDIAYYIEREKDKSWWTLACSHLAKLCKYYNMHVQRTYM